MLLYQGKPEPQSLSPYRDDVREFPACYPSYFDGDTSKILKYFHLSKIKFKDSLVSLHKN